MKQLILITGFALVAAFLAAQEAHESTYAMAHGVNPAFYVDIPAESVSYVDKQWRTYIDQYGKLRKVPKSSERVIEQTRIHHFGGIGNVDVFSRTESVGTSIRQIIWIHSDGKFLSSDHNPDAAKGAKKLLEDFAQTVKVNQIAEELEKEEERLSDLQRDLEKLVKTRESLDKTIEDAKAKIAEAEAGIEENTQMQEVTNTDMEKQREIIEEVRKRLEDARGGQR